MAPPQEGGGGFQFPAAPPGTPGLPQNATFIVFDGFDGLNTKPSRPAIGDQQLAYSNNFIPLGHSNLRTLYDAASALYTATPRIIENLKFANFGDTPVAILFRDDGSVVQVNTQTSAFKSVAPAGTITNASGAIGFSQWGGQYVLFCAPQTNGYFIWDNISLYKAGTLGPQVLITNGGLGYSSIPQTRAVRNTGVDTSAAFSTGISNGSVTSLTVTNPSSSYTVTSYAFVAFSGGGVIGKTAIGTATINSTGGVVAVAILSANVGLGYTATTQVSLLGGGGLGATASVAAFSGTGVQTLTLGSSGSGYSDPPTVVIADVNNPVAQATITPMPFGISGTTIETFTSRVWIGNGDDPTEQNQTRVLFSAPTDPANFNESDGGGSFVSTDSFLRVGFHGLKQSNGFLYLAGDSSFNYISGVQTTGNPPVTTFGNNNVDPQIGSPWQDTIQVFSRSIVFANPFGVHALSGGAADKVSPPLDGIYATVPLANFPITPSAAVVDIFGIRCYVLLYPIIDNYTGQQRNAFLGWDGKYWFTASQTPSITRIAGQEINSVLTAWGTDGNSLYQLFASPNPNLQKINQSKLWDKPTYMMTKTAQRLFGVVKGNGGGAATFNFTVDTEKATGTTITVTAPAIQWINTLSQVVLWVNNSAMAVDWSAANALNVFDKSTSISGRMLGLTTTTYAQDATLISVTMLAQQQKLNN